MVYKPPSTCSALSIGTGLSDSKYKVTHSMNGRELDYSNLFSSRFNIFALFKTCAAGCYAGFDPPGLPPSEPSYSRGPNPGINSVPVSQARRHRAPNRKKDHSQVVSKKLSSQYFSALLATSLNYLAAILRTHALTETVYFFTLSYVRLESRFHYIAPPRGITSQKYL